jgi:hypothetical protein
MIKNKVMKTKQKFTVYYGLEKITKITGTKRTIINRLKNISTPLWCDSLFIEQPDGDIKPYEEQSFFEFSDKEYDEVKNI